MSLTVDDGEALAVIGPNGAGKTTLFNLISGDVAPSAGTIVFAGSDMTAMPPHARSRLGHWPLLSNSAPVREHDRVRESAGRRDLRRRRHERESYERCSDVLEVTGLYDKANVPARTLTLLQRKRLEIARALAIEPQAAAA